ncbi:MAG: hypothetical protein LCH30_05520 [Proteobacteria bacterium]|nr:hypothetical protein [Pseudomonadota bacterium]
MANTKVVIPTTVIPTSYHKEKYSDNGQEIYLDPMLDLYEAFKLKLKTAHQTSLQKPEKEEPATAKETKAEEAIEGQDSKTKETTETTPNKVTLSNEEQFLLNIEFIANNRAQVASLLETNIHLLDSNIAGFVFLTKEQQSKKREELLYLFYLLYAQYTLDLAETRQYVLNKHRENLNLCSKLLEQLNLLLNKENTAYESFKYQLAIEETWTEKYLKLSGLFLAKIFVQALHDLFLGSTTKTLKEWMSDVNGLRLEWVWEGGLLRAILELWPTSLFNKTQTTASLDTLSPITGYMSWVLYYFRGGLELFALMKHTTNALWWKSAEEEKIPLKERFLTQWNERKFRILNDLIWATANLLCFFVLTGSGVLGYFGNVATALLLLMDVCLTYWKYKEAETKHNATIGAWEEERDLYEKADSFLNAENESLADTLKTLQADIDKLSAKQNDENLSSSQRKSLRFKFAELEATKRKAELLDRIIAMSQTEREYKAQNLQRMINKKNYEWKYEYQGFTKDILYAVGLLVAFGLVACFFIPPAQIALAISLSIALVGAALCFIVTVANSAYESYLDYAKFKDNHQSIESLWESTLKKLKEKTDELEQYKNKPNDDPDKKLLIDEQQGLYLELKSLVVDSYLQQESVSLQKLKIAKKMLFDIMLPVVVFSALMFTPLNIGLPILGAFLAIFAIIHLIVKWQEPQKEKMLDFNRVHFNEFIKLVETSESPSLLTDPKAKQCLLAINDKEEKEKAKANSSTLFGHPQKPDGDGSLPAPTPSSS